MALAVCQGAEKGTPERIAFWECGFDSRLLHVKIQGMKLTIEQLAERSAKKKNRHLKEECPLFADQFATTPEQEAERIKRQQADSQQHIAKINEASREAYERGMKYRQAAYKLLGRKLWAERERAWLKRFPSGTIAEERGFDLADHWWCALKGTDYARENCPLCQQRNYQHSLRFNYLTQQWEHVTHCPTCGAKLDSANKDTQRIAQPTLLCSG